MMRSIRNKLLVVYVDSYKEQQGHTQLQLHVYVCFFEHKSPFGSFFSELALHKMQFRAMQSHFHLTFCL